MKQIMRRLTAVLLLVVLTLGMANVASDMKEPVKAEGKDMNVAFCMDFHGTGWSTWSPDNRRVYRTTSWPTAFRAALQDQPKELTGTVQYEAYITGQGWTGTKENGEVCGQENSSITIEAVKVWLNGDLKDHYDIYTMAMVKGQWLHWVKNGDVAGETGAGKHIDGLRIAVVKKGATPEETVETGTAAATFSSSHRVDGGKPMIALTFDDGPGLYEDRIMDALDKVGGKATFFMVGNLVGSYSKTVKRMADSGHELGNHSWAHDNLSKLSPDGIRNSVNKCNQAILQATGKPATVVRPPYGATGGSCKSTLGSMGYASILWSIDTLDWKHKNADKTVSTVLSQVKDGDIILMHSIYSQSAAAAERLIPELTKRGFQLVTVSELAAARGGMAPGKNYGSFR